MISNAKEALSALGKIGEARERERACEKRVEAAKNEYKLAMRALRQAAADLAKLLDGETADLPLFDAQPPPEPAPPAKPAKPRKAKPEPRADARVKPLPMSPELAPPGEDEYGVSRRTSGGTFAVGTVFARTKSEATDRAADTWPQFTRDEIVLSRIVRAPETAP